MECGNIANFTLPPCPELKTKILFKNKAYRNIFEEYFNNGEFEKITEMIKKGKIIISHYYE